MAWKPLYLLWENPFQFILVIEVSCFPLISRRGLEALLEVYWGQGFSCNMSNYWGIPGLLRGWPAAMERVLTETGEDSMHLVV